MNPSECCCAGNYWWRIIWLFLLVLFARILFLLDSKGGGLFCSSLFFFYFYYDFPKKLTWLFVVFPHPAEISVYGGEDPELLRGDHLVLSKEEQLIDSWLEERGIAMANPVDNMQ